MILDKNNKPYLVIPIREVERIVILIEYNYNVGPCNWLFPIRHNIVIGKVDVKMIPKF